MVFFLTVVIALAAVLEALGLQEKEMQRPIQETQYR